MLFDERMMKLALEEARRESEMGEIPVGAVITNGQGEVVAVCHNLCEAHQQPTAHAELLAVEEACRRLGSWRLSDCTLYATLEPCPMCMGALLHARISRVVFGARDPRAGACGSLLDLASYPLECRPEITEGLMAEESLTMLRDFFASKRKKKDQTQE